MPVMSWIERRFCASAAWQYAGKAVDSLLDRSDIGRNVLEIGCGAGLFADRLLADRPDATLTAVDLDPHMVQAAADRLHRFPSASVQVADATNLPFADDSFDTVISRLMLHHVIDWDLMLAEIARVLRPGGRVLGYDATRNRLWHTIHVLDGSPFRLAAPTEIRAELAHNHLTPTVDLRWGGQFMTLSA
uniref:class I SAM-dependent methyltransferase n=1 Tax=Gordonia sp. B7-2 TaxID=3420932 RepID=UPI003D8D6080